MWLWTCFIVLGAYLLGNLNGSILVSRVCAHEDVRTHGSGNAGLTNFARSYGGIFTLVVLLVDVGKTVAACLLGGFLLRPYGFYLEGVTLGALLVSLGHDFPALLGFRGGKGVLCGITAVYLIDWWCGLVITGIFLLAYLLTGFVSLGSISGAAGAIVYLCLFYRSRPLVLAGGCVLALLIIGMHHANIHRLFTGKEPKTNLLHKIKK